MFFPFDMFRNAIQYRCRWHGTRREKLPETTAIASFFHMTFLCGSNIVHHRVTQVHECKNIYIFHLRACTYTHTEYYFLATISHVRTAELSIPSDSTRRIYNPNEKQQEQENKKNNNTWKRKTNGCTFFSPLSYHSWVWCRANTWENVPTITMIRTMMIKD